MFGRKKEAPKEGRKGGGEALLNQVSSSHMNYKKMTLTFGDS